MFSLEFAVTFFWQKMDKNIYTKQEQLIGVRQFNKAGREDNQSSH